MGFLFFPIWVWGSAWRPFGAAGAPLKNILYADDTTLLLRDLDSVHTLLETLENFRGCSGLDLNKSKREAIWLGPWVTRKDATFQFRRPENSAYALGIHFSNDRSKCESLNFDKKLEDLEKILNSWKRRRLTLLGKSTLSSHLDFLN